MDPLLVAEGIRHVYSDIQGELVALDGVSLVVSRDEFVTIVGPAGCGKSTLLRILGGVLVPSGGWVHLGEQPLVSPGRQVGYVFQSVNLMPWRTVLRNVTLPLEVAHVPQIQAEGRARELLALVGVEGLANAFPHELPGDMIQRVAIARALVSDPEVLLFDEPFGALDAQSRERMNLEVLRIWQARRFAAVMVTRSLPEAVLMADRVLVMSPRPGRICSEVVVSLPRPRTCAAMHSDLFEALLCCVREAFDSGDDPGPMANLHYQVSE